MSEFEYIPVARWEKFNGRTAVSGVASSTRVQPAIYDSRDRIPYVTVHRIWDNVFGRILFRISPPVPETILRLVDDTDEVLLFEPWPALRGGIEDQKSVYRFKGGRIRSSKLFVTDDFYVKLMPGRQVRAEISNIGAIEIPIDGRFTYEGVAVAPKDPDLSLSLVTAEDPELRDHIERALDVCGREIGVRGLDIHELFYDAYKGWISDEPIVSGRVDPERIDLPEGSVHRFSISLEVRRTGKSLAAVRAEDPRTGTVRFSEIFGLASIAGFDLHREF